MRTEDDFFNDETVVPDGDARAMAAETIGRVFIWVSDGRTLEDRGFRASIALASVRPDLLGGATLEEIGLPAGRQRQAVWKLRQDFRRVTGL